MRNTGNKKNDLEDKHITALEYYYDKQEIPIRECLLALKSIVLSMDREIVHTRKHQIPFFCYNDLNLGFLWVHRKKIIVGFVEDKNTLAVSTSGRKRDSVFTIEVDPLEDIPVRVIKENFMQLIKKYNEVK